MYEAAQNFELFSSIQNQNLINRKPATVDVLFKGYHLSLQSSYGTVLLYFSYFYYCGKGQSQLSFQCFFTFLFTTTYCIIRRVQ